KEMRIDDRMIILPSDEPEKVDVIRGPNIAPLPIAEALPERMEKKVLLKVGDNISTDAIMPAGAKVLPLRSNIPKISEFVFSAIDPQFAKHAKENGGGIVIGGENYGQGSSREHAALAPMYLGIKAVIAKNFARIHKANLINFGILPLEFEKTEDYEKISAGDVVVMSGLREHMKGNVAPVTLQNQTKGIEIKLKEDYTKRQREILLAGGLLNYTRMGESKMAHDVTLILGDGTGPELARATKRVLDATGVKFNWVEQEAGMEVFERTGDPFPETLIETIRRTKVAIKAPITTPVAGGFRSVNVKLRKDLDLYINLRPAKSYKGVRSRYEDLDLVIFRENTDDLYVGIEFEQGKEDTKKLIEHLQKTHPSEKIPSDIGIS
ncbi:MAG: isocitrate/isopropylmalate family dehydrogenase, partial [archaeon]